MKVLGIIVLLSIFGCAHVISEGSRQALSPGVYTEALFQNPEFYKGKIVMLGGVIASSKNTPEGTYIEVVEEPLDRRGRPIESDISRGRFIALYEGYLETIIYSQGRDITVVGEVLGIMQRKLGDIDYNYLLLKAKEIKLIKPYQSPSVTFGIGILHTF